VTASEQAQTKSSAKPINSTTKTPSDSAIVPDHAEIAHSGMAAGCDLQYDGLANPPAGQALAEEEEATAAAAAAEEEENDSDWIFV
jgi:hypothetical protein